MLELVYETESQVKPMNRVLWLLVLLISIDTAGADSWRTPKPKTWTSPRGTATFRLLDPHMMGASRGVVLVRTRGRERVLWDRPLINTPVQALVADDGSALVTIDTYGKLGQEHAVVVYGRKGQSVADFRLEDLLTKEEIKRYVPRTVSSRLWASKATFTLERSFVVIRLQWGRTIRVDLARGTLH
jgi:hypothetical protein